MDYRVVSSKEDLDGTDYIEIGPGRYSGWHWQEGFLFVQEEMFALVAEGIITRYLPEYDHFGMNEVPASIGRKLINDWRSAALHLLSCDADNVSDVLNLNSACRKYLINEILSNRQEISRMLGDMSNSCEAFYEKNDWICILGV